NTRNFAGGANTISAIIVNIKHQLSPTLFSIYVNDLAQEIKKTNLADEEIKLQGMLNTMNDWCNKWRLTINSDKTQIVHFRKPLVPQSNFLFYFGKTTLMFTDTYKYLGFVFHKNMMFSEGKQSAVWEVPL
uniref:Reverse transcriptase domain-containing protein n=1 Tax=Oryzias latipes TaxID=8090 RepID=A0A3P9KUI9_ORYLA